MQTQQFSEELVGLATRLTPLEGLNQTLVDDVSLLRRSRSIPRFPVLHEPSIIIIIQGKKSAYVGSEKLVYKARTVLVLSAPIPFECIMEVPHNQPLLSVYVRFRRDVVIDLLSKMRETSSVHRSHPKAIQVMTLGEDLSQCLTRLLKILTSVDDARVLGEQVVRELIYCILKGEGGDGVRAMVDAHGHFAQIYGVLQQMHDEYSKPLEVARLAQRAGMSVSTFHLYFKQVASTSPIQYMKAVRMHKARSLMLETGISANGAANQVGYKSASQFGREFKRFFGSSPVQEAAKFLR